MTDSVYGYLNTLVKSVFREGSPQPGLLQQRHLAALRPDSAHLPGTVQSSPVLGCKHLFPHPGQYGKIPREGRGEDPNDPSLAHLNIAKIK